MASVAERSFYLKNVTPEPEQPISVLAAFPLQQTVRLAPFPLRYEGDME